MCDSVRAKHPERKSGGTGSRLVAAQGRRRGTGETQLTAKSTRFLFDKMKMFGKWTEVMVHGSVNTLKST